jgi:hypothetical protein
MDLPNAEREVDLFACHILQGSIIPEQRFLDP